MYLVVELSSFRFVLLPERGNENDSSPAGNQTHNRRVTVKRCTNIILKYDKNAFGGIQSLNSRSSFAMFILKINFKKLYKFKT